MVSDAVTCALKLPRLARASADLISTWLVMDASHLPVFYPSGSLTKTRPPTEAALTGFAVATGREKRRIA